MLERYSTNHANNAFAARRVAVTVVWLALTAPSVALSQSTGPQVSGAAALFEKQCYSCHNIGGGDKKGPDLMGVTDQRGREWIHRFVVSPTGMKRAGDRAAVELFSKYSPEVMPDQMLALDQIDQILDMIQELSRKKEAFVPQSGKLSRQPVPQDVPIGRRLFIGQARLSGGGPACIACHAVAGTGYLGGGTLGPDLTNANLKYKDVELASILKVPGFPTMSRVFADHELTDEEVVKLFAFLQSVRTRIPDTARPASRYLICSTAGVAVLLCTMTIVWRGRLRGVRRQLRRGRP